MLNDEKLIQEIKDIVKKSYNYSTVLRILGWNNSGSSYKKIKKIIKENNIDITHFKGHAYNKGLKDLKGSKKKEKYSLEDVLCKDSKVSQKILRGYVKRHNIIEYKCSFCGNNGIWRNTEISLELDHIDGDNHNNEVENLRYLCPNCHASTITYRGKNKKLKKQKNADVVE